MKTKISEEEIMSKQTPAGGWTKQQLAHWGVPWPPPNAWKKEILQHGIPYSKIIETFGGGEIVTENNPFFCKHCDCELIPRYERLWDAHAPVKQLVALLEERHGNIVEATWPNGRRQWQCSCCGRKAITGEESRKNHPR
jgi:hypothetical protein